MLLSPDIDGVLREFCLVIAPAMLMMIFADVYLSMGRGNLLVVLRAVWPENIRFIYVLLDVRFYLFFFFFFLISHG